MANSEKAITLFEHLRIEISKLDYSDNNRIRIQDLLERTKALIVNTFSSASSYTGDINQINPTPSHAGLKNRPMYFEKGKRQLINLIDIMIDDLELMRDAALQSNTRVSNDDSLEKTPKNLISEATAQILVNPFWKGRGFAVEDDLCFLVMPFTESWSDAVWETIKTSVTDQGMRCERADEHEGRMVMEDIWTGICRAKVIIADLTDKNPNVTYEVGLADVLGKNVILLSQFSDKLPFDFLGQRLILYKNTLGGEKKLAEELKKRLQKYNQPKR